MLVSSKVALILLIFATPLLAQTLYGSLVGTVTDDSGLAVPGATVTITHTETNQKRDSTTNATGGYNFPNIPTGTYQVEITLTGFNTFRARDIIVQQNNSVRIDAKLGVGALQETVLVSGTAAILQTESAAVQSVTTSQQIENLPTGRTCRLDLFNRANVGLVVHREWCQLTVQLGDLKPRTIRSAC